MQDDIKYIATTDNRVLCIKGWVLKNRLNANQIRLFDKPCSIIRFIKNKKNYLNAKYKIEKVNVKIEVVENDIILYICK